MTEIRDQIIEITSQLMEIQGYYPTSLNQILRMSGASKHLLHRLFPYGKEEIGSEAIRRYGDIAAERIRREIQTSNLSLGDSAQAVAIFIRDLANLVEESDFQSVGPLAAIALETAVNNERMNLACRDAYSVIQAVWREKLEQTGIESGRAGLMAQFITAAVEGGIILSRTEHSGNPLRLVADQIESLLKGDLGS